MHLNIVSRIFLVCGLAAGSAVATPPAVSQEPARYGALMHRADQLAERHRDLEKGSDEARRVEQELRKSLVQAFEVRQAEQRSEIKTLREELESAERRLDEREKLQEMIVSRKLEALLSDADVAWPEGDPDELEKQLAFDVIEAGDTVAVYIASILPPNSAPSEQSSPPVRSLPSGQVVSGFPLVVASDGTIRLPMIDPVEIAGLSVREAESRIDQTYIDQKILRPDRSATILTLVPQEKDPSRGARKEVDSETPRTNRDRQKELSDSAKE